MPVTAYLTGTYPAWSETFIQREMRGLIGAGLPLLPMAIQRGEGELPEGIPSPLYLQEAAFTGAFPARRARLPLPAAMRRIASLVKHQGELDRLMQLAATHQATHLHAAFGDLPGLLVAAAARRLDLPYSIGLHAVDALQEKFDAAFIYGGARFLTICNRRVHGAFIQRHPQLAARTHLVPHGLPLSDWPMREAPWQPHQPLRLLFVGRLIERKRPDLAVEVVSRLNRDGLTARLTIVGDGPMAPALPQRDDVSRYGILPPGDVRKTMLESDALLVTSDERPHDMEGLPNVVLEAMATGLPVIAPLTGSIGDVLDETTGLPAPAGDADAFAAACRRLVAQPDAVQARCLAARRRVEQNYDAAAHLATRLALFRDAQATH